MKTMWAIARNTLNETLRQSVFGVLLVGACILILLSPAFTMFTLMHLNDGGSSKMVLDMGLATILLAGLLMAVFSATTVVSREIGGRTALTVLAKPVSREAFVIGKFLGISLAILVATLIMSVVLMQAVRFGVKDTASTKLNWLAMGSIAGVLFGSVLIGLAYNYFLGKPFLTAAIWSALCMCMLVFVVFSFQNEDREFGGLALDYRYVNMLWGTLLNLEATLILTAVAVAASTRGNVVSSLIIVASIFVGGLVIEFFFGAHVETSSLARVFYSAVPNFQVFWVMESLYTSDAVAKKRTIPLQYVAQATLYTACYIGAVLALALALFERREVTE